jgi:hypothetical protein
MVKGRKGSACRKSRKLRDAAQTCRSLSNNGILRAAYFRVAKLMIDSRTCDNILHVGKCFSSARRLVRRLLLVHIITLIIRGVGASYYNRIRENRRALTPNLTPVTPLILTALVLPAYEKNASRFVKFHF